MEITPPKVAIRFTRYAPLIGLSKSALYALPEPLQPHSVKIGRARIVTEPPSVFLERLAAAQGEAQK